MDIVRVRYFLAVCEHGSFTAAAKASGVSQPSVTTGVRRLERAIGAALVERRHPVRLTPIGERLLPLLKVLQEAADAVTAACAEACGHKPAGLLGRGASAVGRPASEEQAPIDGARATESDLPASRSSPV